MIQSDVPELGPIKHISLMIGLIQKIYSRRHGECYSSPPPFPSSFLFPSLFRGMFLCESRSVCKSLTVCFVCRYF